MRLTLSHWTWLHLGLVGTTSLAKLVNITVDDAGEDPTTHASIQYTTANAWNFGPSCGDCAAVLDQRQTSNQTWHDASFDPKSVTSNTPQNATFSFTGG